MNGMCQELGLPTLRRRTYGVAVRRETMVWLGPNALDVTEDFLKIFGRAPSLNGDIYAGLDSEELIAENLLELGKRRGIHELQEDMDLKSLFTPACQERINKAQEQHLASKLDVGSTSAFIFDASQSDYRNRAHSRHDILPVHFLDEGACVHSERDRFLYGVASAWTSTQQVCWVLATKHQDAFGSSQKAHERKRHGFAAGLRVASVRDITCHEVSGSAEDAATFASRLL